MVGGWTGAARHVELAVVEVFFVLGFLHKGLVEGHEFFHFVGEVGDCGLDAVAAVEPLAVAGCCEVG